jgi:hypothetical protein
MRHNLNTIFMPRNSCPHNEKAPLTFLPKGFFLKKVGATRRLLKLFIAGVQGWETGLRRIFVCETSGGRP